jgi:cytochrome c-type biogenesis protein CcmF
MFFVVVSIVIIAVRWKSIPASEKEIKTYSREFWIFVGATVLCLMGFQVLVPTSYPVWNKFWGFFGVHSNIASPANQVQFYSAAQLWFAAAVAIISGTGQFFWWRRMEKDTWKKEVMPVVLGSLILFALVIALGKIYEPSYMVLALAGVYIIVSNIRVLTSLLGANPKFSGGAVAHIGVGMMLLGVLFSAGQSKVVSLNNNGLIIKKDLGTEFNRDNLFLFINEPRTMADYDIEYRGERLELRDKSGYVKKSDVIPTFNKNVVIAKKDVFFDGKKLYNALDTFAIYGENTYYEIELRKNDKLAATLFPRVQVNEGMGGFIASPDIKKDPGRDIYTHISGYPNPEEPLEWSKQEEINVSIGQQFFVNDYVAVLEDVRRIDAIPGYKVAPEDVAVQARIKVQGEREEYVAEPVFLIEDKREVRVMPVEINDLGVKLVMLNIHPETNTFTLGLTTRQKDWVVIKAKEFPLINVLWLGTGVLMVGFVIALVRRFKDHLRDR